MPPCPTAADDPERLLYEPDLVERGRGGQPARCVRGASVREIRMHGGTATGTVVHSGYRHDDEGWWLTPADRLAPRRPSVMLSASKRS